jgi:hypothetical protein
LKNGHCRDARQSDTTSVDPTDAVRKYTRSSTAFCTLAILDS